LTDQQITSVFPKMICPSGQNAATVIPKSAPLPALRISACRGTVTGSPRRIRIKLEDRLHTAFQNHAGPRIYDGSLSLNDQ
jgi:hypothetical protein